MMTTFGSHHHLHHHHHHGHHPPTSSSVASSTASGDHLMNNDPCSPAPVKNGYLSSGETVHSVSSSVYQGNNIPVSQPPLTTFSSSSSSTTTVSFANHINSNVNHIQSSNLVSKDRMEQQQRPVVSIHSFPVNNGKLHGNVV